MCNYIFCDFWFPYINNDHSMNDICYFIKRKGLLIFRNFFKKIMELDTLSGKVIKFSNDNFRLLRIRSRGLPGDSDVQ